MQNRAKQTWSQQTRPLQQTRPSQQSKPLQRSWSTQTRSAQAGSNQAGSSQTRPGQTEAAKSNGRIARPRRWHVLAAMSVGASILFTIGIALFSLRGVASANQAPEGPPRPGLTFVKEIGGAPRAATPNPNGGTAPTLRLENDPAYVASRPPAPEGASAAGQPIAGQPPAGMAALDPLYPAPIIDSRSSGSASSGGPWLTAPAPSGQANSLPSASASPSPAASPVVSSSPVALPPGASSATAYGVPPSAPAAVAATPPAPPAPQAPTAPQAAPAAAAARSADAPPTVRILLSDDRIELGDRFTVTVIANDDKGLESMAWDGLDTGDSEIDRIHNSWCEGQTQCSRVWNATFNRSGDFTLRARARGSAGQVSQAATATISVRRPTTSASRSTVQSAAPTATAPAPTATVPAPTATAPKAPTPVAPTAPTPKAPAATPTKPPAATPTTTSSSKPATPTTTSGSKASTPAPTSSGRASGASGAQTGR